MKKKIEKHNQFSEVLWRFLIMVKAVWIIVLASVLQVSAGTNLSYSQSVKMNIHLENVDLEQVIWTMKKQSEFNFLYSNEDVRDVNKLDIEMKDATAETILDYCLKGTGLTYEIVNKAIIIKKSEGDGSRINNGLPAQSKADQKRELSGTVKDSKGLPLPGVTVVVKATTLGTITDNDGNFRLSVPSDAKTLAFSFIGMKSQEITIIGKTIVNITLDEETVGVDEVIVIGYGTQKKETVTGAVAQIKATEILTTKSTSLVSNLQGKVVGVQIRQQTAEPGKFNSKVSIRGFGAPLVVIDGVARDGMSDFERLNPEDIESVSVLKDASAAIYGMNSDNGVIIVTTKKGVKGRTKFSYSSFFGIKQPTNEQKSVDAYTYRVVKNEMQRNIGNALAYNDAELEKWKLGTEPGYQDYNWSDLILKKITTQQQHNLSINGGNDNITFYTSLGFMEDNGLLKSNIQKYKKYNFRNSITAKLAKGLTAKISFSGKFDENTSPQNGYEWVFKPIVISDRGIGPFSLKNPEHVSIIPPTATNAYALATESISGYDKWSNLQYQTTVDLTYEIPYVKGLTLGLLGAYDGNVNDASNLAKAYYQYDFITDAPSAASIPTYEDGITNFTRKDFQAQISYKNTFSQAHNIGATLVYEMKKTSTKYLYAKRQYDDVYTHDIINEGSLTNASNAGNFLEQAFMSYLGRFNYDYKNKYLLEFTFREDGSYRYAPSKRWAFFPAVSGGWRVGEEAFVKNNAPFITNLKIRGSYGLMGADAGNPFQYYEGYTFGGVNGGYVFNNNVLTMGMVPPGVVNDNLTWVKTSTADIGVDLDLWNGKLGFTMDIFQKNRNGLLGTRIQSVPNTFGASFPQDNINSDMVKGYELMVSHKDKIGDFAYGVSANVTYSRRYLIHTERTPYSSSMEEWKDVWGNNRILGRDWGYEYKGVYTDITQYETAPLLGGANGNSKNLPGSTRITDVNGDGVINANDMLPIFWAGQYGGAGSAYATNPPLQYGFNMNASWKGFDFNVLLQGSALFSISTKVGGANTYGGNPTLWEKYLDRWHTEDTNADPFDPATKWISGKYPALKTNQAGTTNGNVTDMWQLDAKYLRIKSVEIGYTLPKSISKKIKVDIVRVYVNAFNLYTFCGEDVKFHDPEREEGAYTADLTYPLLRSFNFGFNVNF